MGRRGKMNDKTAWYTSFIDPEKSFVTQHQEYIVVLDERGQQMSGRQKRAWKRFWLLTLQGERFENQKQVLPYLELNREREYLFGGMVDWKNHKRKNRILLLRRWEEGFEEVAAQICKALDAR